MSTNLPNRAGQQQEKIDKLTATNKALAAAIAELTAHPCCHPPSCGHGRFSECRNELVAAIHKAGAALRRAGIAK